MINGLPPYPAYKDSGVPWLGEVPEHWEVRRGKALFRCIDVRSSTGGEELLTVSSERGVVPRSSTTVTMFRAESYSGYKLCWPGDLVINSLWAWGGGLGVSRHHGIVSSAYGVYRLRAQYTDYSAYMHELVRSTPFNWELRVRSRGIWISRLQLSDEAFLRAPFPLPPLAEQAAIVRFLDHADRRIRRYIRGKQKLIKLLKEQKQAIIHGAVTRGLDPNIRLKFSGVAWLGDVPEHWEVLRFSRVIGDGPRNGISPPVDENGTTESFSISAVRDGKVNVRESDRKYVKRDDRLVTTSYGLLRGDILIVRGNGNVRLVGKAGVVEDEMPGRVYPDLLMRVRVTDRASPQFVAALLNGSTTRDQIETAARTAVGTFKINNQQVRQLWLALPPRSEQQQILEWASKSTRLISAIAERTAREVELLYEYRVRLVADVVTGKLDVREAAAALPDKAEDIRKLGDDLDTIENGCDNENNCDNDNIMDIGNMEDGA